MTRRLMLLLAATWPWSSRGIAQERRKSKSNPESATGRDSAVLEAVLKDLLTWSQTPLEPRNATTKEILFAPNAVTRPVEAAEVLRTHSRDEWAKLSPEELGLAREAAENLARRSEAKDALKGLKFNDPRIVVWDKARGKITAMH